MVSNLIFSLDRVAPYFLLIVLGVVLRRTGLASRDFFAGANKFTFKVALPLQLFMNISGIKREALNANGFVLYIIAVTFISFLLIWGVTELLYHSRKELIGTLVQGGFRGNFVLLGAPIAEAVLGSPAVRVAALASIVVVPTYNILSVVALSARGKNSGGQSVGRVLRDVVTNPLIIAICAAFPVIFFGIKLPNMAQTTLNYIAQTATPLGLLSIGGMLDWQDVTARLRPALYASLVKNLLLPVTVMFASYFIGFRNEELLVILVMSAAPVAISSYAMASEMGGDAPLASNILILSTFFSGFTLAFGIYVLKTLALI